MNQYIISIIKINILFPSRTYMYTGENHNESGMDRKKTSGFYTLI